MHLIDFEKVEPEIAFSEYGTTTGKTAHYKSVGMDFMWALGHCTHKFLSLNV